MYVKWLANSIDY